MVASDAAEFGVPAERYLALLYTESNGFRPEARNPGSSAVGLNQQVPSETKAFYPELVHLSDPKRQEAVQHLADTIGWRDAMMRQLDAAKDYFKFYLFNEGSPRGKLNQEPLSRTTWDNLSDAAKIGVMYKCNTISAWDNYKIRAFAAAHDSASVLNLKVGQKDPVTSNDQKAAAHKAAYSGNPAFRKSPSATSFTIGDMVDKVKETERFNAGYKKLRDEILFPLLKAQGATKDGN